MPYHENNGQNGEVQKVNGQHIEDLQKYQQISTLIESEYLSGPIQHNVIGDERTNKALTQSRVSFISSILDNVETTERMQLSEQEKERWNCFACLSAPAAKKRSCP